MLLTKTPNQRKDLQTLEHLNSPIPSVQSTHFTGLVPISARMCHRTQYRVLSTLYYYYYYQKHLYQKLVPKMRIHSNYQEKKIPKLDIALFFWKFSLFLLLQNIKSSRRFLYLVFLVFSVQIQKYDIYIYLVGQRLQLRKLIRTNFKNKGSRTID